MSRRLLDNLDIELPNMRLSPSKRFIRGMGSILELRPRPRLPRVLSPQEAKQADEDALRRDMERAFGSLPLVDIEPIEKKQGE